MKNSMILCFKIISTLGLILIVYSQNIIAKSNNKDVKIVSNKPTINVKLVNTYEKDVTLPIAQALDERYNVQLNDKDYDIVIYSVFHDDRDRIKSLKEDSEKIKFFYTYEAALPNLNDYDLTLGFDHINDPKYIRFPFYINRWKSKLTTENIKGNQRAELGTCKPNKPVFACFLVTNGGLKMHWLSKTTDIDGTVARDSLFHKLSEYKKVESGGKHLNNIGRIVPHEETQEWLGRCKFIIAYENQSYNGYITEKPFQAYFAGSVPIYYSSQSAVQDINKDAVIFAPDFKDEGEVVEYIKKVDQDDDLYCKIWNQNLITDPDMAYDNYTAKIKQKIFEILDSKLKR